MKTNSTSRSPFFNPRVLVGSTLCSAGILLASAELYTLPTGTVNPVPLINQPLVPDAVAPGGAEFTLTVNGTSFVSGSLVSWNGSARATTFVSSSQLAASILLSDIATAGTASVTVVNPSPGGGTSNVVFFPITIPASSIALNRSDYATGLTPTSLATADLNRDGRLDLAVVDYGEGKVSILLGNGDGTFQAHVDYATGGFTPSTVVVRDLNGDGRFDLAVRNQGSNTVSVLLGNGDGTFQNPVMFPTGPYKSRLAVGDFNGDGVLDLVTTNNGNNTISILLGNGDGTFQSHVDYATGSSPLSLAVGDFNRDGMLDVVTGNIVANTFSILLGNGDGTFQNHGDYSTIRNPQSVVTADFNGDGKLDLAIFSENRKGTAGLSILLGNGDGTFQSFASYPDGCGSLDLECTATADDLNGDGKLDLAVRNAELDGAKGNVLVLLGNGDGTFQSALTFETGLKPEQVVAGDFNGDGRLDLAVPNFNDNTVSVLLQGTTVALSDISLGFGLQLVDTISTAKVVTLTNTGPTTLNISSITSSGDFLQENNCGSAVPAGASCTIRIAFRPSAKGARTGAVTITDDAADSPQTVALMGTGTVVQLTPMNVNFGNQRVGTTSPPRTVTLTNTGSTSLSIHGIAVTGVNFGDFVETTTCGSSLPAHTSCAIQVRFLPAATGAREESLRVRDDGGGGTQDVELRGTGIL